MDSVSVACTSCTTESSFYTAGVDTLPEEMNDMKIRDDKENGTETGHIIVTTIGGTNGQPQQTISYMAERIVGQGSFGVVFQAKCLETGETVAIKKVLQNKRYKNRELQTMRLLDHPNVVSLKHCFFSTTEKDELYRNLVLEYVPETVHLVIKHYNKLNQRMPMIYVKLYAYQIFRALSYIHRSIGVCHRDIKPQNLLVNPHTHQVKLCDFGSAKVLVKGEPNISYICSRYYRAPELIFGATEYSTAIDIWSSGCVVAEMMLGKPLFPGESGVDQLIEIIKVLGTPAREEIKCMNPNYTELRLPQIKAHPWHKIFHKRMPPEAVDLVSRLLQYSPNLRCTALDALIHPFFDELRYPNTRLPTGRFLPPLFNFKSHGINPKTNKLNGKKDLLFNELDFTSVVITKDEYSISKPHYGSTKTTSKSKFEEPKEKGDGTTNLEDQCAALGSLASIKDDSSIISKGSTGKNKTVAKNELSPQEVPSASVLPLTSSNTSAVEAEREIQVENESISGVTMPKSSLRSSGSKKPGLSVTWADEKLDSCGSRDLCEVRGLGGDGSDNNADNMLRFASAEACAMAMSQAAEAIASGDSDVADAVSEAGVIILPCPHDGDDGESTEDPDVLELEDPLNWPSKSGIPHSDLFDPEDSWYDAPPEEFGLTEGLLNTMSFIDPLPAFRVKQWQVITFVFLDALSICRIPTLIPHMTNRTILLHKVLIVAQITAEEYEVMKDFIMPLGRAPNFSTQSGA